MDFQLKKFMMILTLSSINSTKISSHERLSRHHVLKTANLKLSSTQCRLITDGVELNFNHCISSVLRNLYLRKSALWPVLRIFYSLCACQLMLINVLLSIRSM